MTLGLKRGGIGAAALAASLMLALCAEAADVPKPTNESAAELAAHARDPVPETPDGKPPPAVPGTPPTIVPGTGRLVGGDAPALAQSAITDEGGITLNFVNADVRDVAKAVFGDFLNVNYALGAGVQGTSTVQTSKPLARAEVLPVFEQILHINGLAIVKNNDVYKIVLAADAPREAGAPAGRGGSAQAGYGTQIVPLRYVAAAEMQRLLESMQPAQAIIHVDATRNILIVQGTSAERAAVVAEVALFDVDWLAGMSFGMFTPKYTDARGLARELNQILGGTGGPLTGLVKLVPIERLNTVMVITPQAKYLEQIGRWVERLDKPGVGSDRRMFVYAVLHGID